MSEPAYAHGGVTIFAGDSLTVLRELPAESVQCCVTSPPFYALRSYLPDDHPDKTLELGSEATPSEYLATMVRVFREVWRVLKPDGTLWIEIGDSYAGAGYSNHANTGGAQREDGGKQRHTKAFRPGNLEKNGGVSNRDGLGAVPGMKPKDLMGMPWALASALRGPWYSGRIKSATDRAWLAAIIDGEGCIHIHRRPAGQSAYSKYTRKDGTETAYARTQDSYGVMVEVTNTSLPLIEHCSEVTGQGGRCAQKEAAGVANRKQTLYRWTMAGTQARELLREIYPYLVAKRQQARIAYWTPSSGPDAATARDAIKLLHSGQLTAVDYPEPPSCFEPGYYLRSDIIWSRSNPMPESVTDRPTKAHSYLFLLAKGERYYYDADAIREPHIEPWRSTGREESTGVKGIAFGVNALFRSHATRPREYNPLGRNRLSVWTIPTEPLRDEHYAAFPTALVKPCILAGSRPGDVVLDPFAGSGTTLLVAKHLERKAIGIELSPAYVAMAARRCQQEVLPLFGEAAGD